MSNNYNTLKLGTLLHGKTYDYEILKILGQGSFGITYLATVKMRGELGAIQVKVAIKEFFMKEINGREGSTVTSGSKGGIFADYRKKFVREAANLSKLRHMNIIKVLECFEANGTVYYAMEYIDGGSLDELIGKRGRLAEAEALRYARQIADALAYMHEHNVLHLDLKPGNIMLRDGNAVLIDFGLSKQYDASGNPESSTTVGGGTSGYAPLEQSSYHEGKGFPVTMDIYALGGTMLKMLTGKRPPDASEILNDGFPCGWLRGVTPATVAVVEKAMSSLRKDRYQSVAEMIAVIGSAKVPVVENPPVIDEVTICDVEEPEPHSEKGENREISLTTKQKKVWKYAAIVVAVCFMLSLVILGIYNVRYSPLEPKWSWSVTASQRAILEKLIANMVKVEGGTYMMGATAEQGSDAYDAYDDEKPAHEVTLSDYYIGKYEVTQAEWEAVMGEKPTADGAILWTSEKGLGGNYPAYYISWNDCDAFIRKLNELTGMKFKLPTEAQWEYAARGGKNSRGYKYSGTTDNLGAVAWYRDNSGNGTHPVGGKQANELGMHDMSGNVWEWCSDWYDKSYYRSSPQTDPTGPSSGSYRVLRGGGWSGIATRCRVADRVNSSVAYRYHDHGLRLAL